MSTINKKRYLCPTLMKSNNWQILSSELNYGSANGILLITLILNADNEGRGKISPTDFKSIFFIFKEEWNNENSIKEMLDNIHELSDNISFYRQNNNIFYQVNKWEKTPQILGRIYREKSTFPILTKNNKICHKINLFGKQKQQKQAQPNELTPEQIGSKPYNKDNPAFIKGPNGQRLRLC